MKRRDLAPLLLAALGALTFPCADAADDVQAVRPLASVQVNVIKKFPNLPAGAPGAIWYGFPEGHGLGCGLLLPGAKSISPLLEPGEDGEWPTCMGMPEAMAFDWHGQPVYVYRYLQRDTREDNYAYDAFVRVGKDGLEGVDGLNTEEQPAKLSIAKAAAWAKASLAATELAQAGFAPSSRDTVLAEHGYLAVGRNAVSGTCSMVVDRLGAGAKLAPVTTPCKKILATTSMSTPQADWLVVMTEGPDGHPQGRVFEVGASGVREATDVETKLAQAVAGGKVLAVKAALKRVVGQ